MIIFIMAYFLMIIMKSSFYLTTMVFIVELPYNPPPYLITKEEVCEKEGEG